MIINRRKEMDLINKVCDNAILIHAFGAEEDVEFRSAILEKTTDIIFLDEVAQDKDYDNTLRKIAIRRCSKCVAREIMEDTLDHVFVRMEAVKNFEDEDYDWYELLQLEENEIIENLIIFEKINNQEQLVDIAIQKSKSDEIIAKKILKKITDEKYLLKIFEQEECDNLKEMALKELQSESNIEVAVGKIDVFDKVSTTLLNTVLEKLISINKEEIITEVLLDIKDKSAIDNYIERISKVGFLKKIMVESSSWYARALAFEKLDELKKMK